ncbi:MAG TPA: hypothetical protein VGU69_10430 [Rhizomicrobium sp.]|nr:hypothetical protein [Rhizomicrobium sp.]
MQIAALVLLPLAACSEDHDRPYMNIHPTEKSSIAMTPDRTLLTQLSPMSAPAADEAPAGAIVVASLDPSAGIASAAPTPLQPVSPPPPPPPPPPPVWTTTPGTKLRDQIAMWVKEINERGCGTPDKGECYRIAAPEPDAPAEPWKLTIQDSTEGDFLDALTWLRDGFWSAPRPDIEVTENNVIILRSVGAP